MGYHLLVLAGGSGTRLWPLSRAAVPKHLIPLGAAGHTLLRATVERVLPLADSVRVVTAASQADACRVAIADLNLGSDAIIAEPQARGTGPALGLATRWLADQDPDATISSVHADHAIGDADAYREAILAAAGWAELTAGLATVGVPPAHPSTSLGYVALEGSHPPPGTWRPPRGARTGADLARAAATPALQGVGFVEKPPLEVAEGYVRDGRHLWNTGLFAWTAAAFEAELARADSSLAERIAEVVRYRRQGDEASAAAAYAAIARVPVDTLIFERTARLTVVEGSFSWSDLGSYTDILAARRDAGEADADGNVLEGDVLALGARDNLVVARGHRPVVVVGVSGLVVIDDGDTVLVVPADQSQRVKEVVERLRAEDRRDLL